LSKSPAIGALALEAEQLLRYINLQLTLALLVCSQESRSAMIPPMPEIGPLNKSGQQFQNYILLYSVYCILLQNYILLSLSLLSMFLVR